MKHFKLSLLCLTALLLLTPRLTQAQDGYFGKNKVNYKNFNWQKIATKNFDIYFYQGQNTLAAIAARIAEIEGEKLSRDFSHKLNARIPVLVYSSHNDFEQTNITQEILEESVGGFTTQFKNRVVVPYTGSYADFQHVLAHEMVHAYMFDLFFGGGMESVLSGQNFNQVSLWFIEGLAEYESRGWDPESEMIIKDLAINQRLIPINELDNYGGSYLVYKEGQAVMRYIARHYGQAKVGELLHLVRANRNVDKACQMVLGQGVEKLSEDWVKSVKKEYWPYLAEKKEASDIGKQLTEHDKNESYFNLSPVLSPRGDKIAYISDQGGYSGIYVISSIDGRKISHLVKGEKNSLFEAMHLAWFRGGLSWSPEGNRLVFAAKSTTGDRLYIVDAGNGKLIRKYKFDLDGIYYPSWSPTDERIVFCGLKNGHADLYLLNNVDGSIKQITSDIYDDREPAWALDGSALVFASDRPIPGDSVVSDSLHFGRYRLFTVNPDGESLACYTPDELYAVSPSWGKSGIIYNTYQQGVANILYRAGPDSASVPLTDVLTGCLQPRWSVEGDKIVFVGYHQTGWNIYTIKNPLEKKPDIKSVIPDTTDTDSSRNKLWQYPKTFSLSAGDTLADPVLARAKFSMDMARGTVGYNTLSGLGGQAQILVTDILGNHLFYLQSDLMVDFENSDYQLAYYYLPKRFDYGVSYYQYHNYYLAPNDDIVIEKVNGVQGIVSYPLNRYQRFDLMASWNHYKQAYYNYSYPEASMDVIVPGLSFVHDNTLWGYMGPISGQRAMLVTETSRKAFGSDLSFNTGYADIRNYWRISRRYQVALRLMGGMSQGPDAQRFYLGGPNSLHGYDYDKFYGTKTVLANFEMRFPLIDRLEMAFPPLSFYGIRGAFFFDVGAAWTDAGSFRALESTDLALVKLDDLKASIGTGGRINLYPFLIRVDVAWPTDLSVIARNPVVSFTLGSEF
ncbi:PD40 domain-containing protein [candidate division TA06 bacterium]|nr:PD40 domain-containing protein [candidate division TA06 bacterium]